MWRALLLLLLPSIALAHTKWFADQPLPLYVTNEPTSLYLVAWGIVASLTVVIGIFFERRSIFSLDILQPKAGHAFVRAASVFSMVSGTFFMIASAYGYLFSPNMVSDIPQWMIHAQFVIGLAFLFGVGARVAAVGLILLWILGFTATSGISMIEDIWVLSTGLFILFMGNDYFSLVSVRILGKYVQHLKSYALPLLRLGTGTTLLILGFSEKILYPEYGVHFLSEHPWNFMQILGFSWFSDYLFTISAGAVEALFGLIFILGIMTRLNAIAIAIFFSIPLFILGPIELAGHVPHFAAVIMLLLFGAGPHFRISRER